MFRGHAEPDQAVINQVQPKLAQSPGPSSKGNGLNIWVRTMPEVSSVMVLDSTCNYVLGADVEVSRPWG